MNTALIRFLPYSFKELKHIRLNGPRALHGSERYKVMKYYKKEILNYKPDILIYSIAITNLKEDVNKLFEE